MDEYDRQQAAKRQADAHLIRELRAVCQQHAAIAFYRPSSGIHIRVDGDVRADVSWEFVATAWRVEHGGPGTHVKATIGELADSHARVAALLCDPAFEAAFAVALTRALPSQAAALERYRRIHQPAAVRCGYGSGAFDDTKGT